MLDKLLKALTEEKKQDRRQQQRRSNGWDCRCGTLDNRPTRATCRDCGAKAPQAFLRRLEQRNRQPQSGGQTNAGPAQRRQPAPSASTDKLKPSWADILAGSPPNRQPTKGANNDPPAQKGAQCDEAAEKETALQDELKKARAMLATAKASELDDSTVDFWQSKVNAIGKLLDQNRPHDARLRSLLDRKKDRETRLEKLEKDEQEAEVTLQEIRTNKATAKTALAEIEAEIETLTASAVPAPAPPAATPADLIMNRLVFEPDQAKQQALISVLKDLGCTDAMIQAQGNFLQSAAAAAASGRAPAGPTPATPAAAGAPAGGGAQKRPADPTPAEARARLEAAKATRDAAEAEARAMEALLDPGATPVASLQAAIEAAEAAEAEAAKKARTEAARKNLVGGPARAGPDLAALAPTVPDSDADDEDDIPMAG